MRSFAGELSLEADRVKFSRGFLPLELSFGIVRLETPVWDMWPGNVRLGSFARELSLGIFGLWVFCLLKAFAWELSLQNIRMGRFAREFALAKCQLGAVPWNLSFGIFRLGILA